jgi:putative transposase
VLVATGAVPVRVPSVKANCYPPALRAVLPQAEHRTAKFLNNRLERDHQHLKGRVRPMRRFKRAGTASTFCRGHAVIRNLCQGFSPLAAALPPRQRLATA